MPAIVGNLMADLLYARRILLAFVACGIQSLNPT